MEKYVYIAVAGLGIALVGVEFNGGKGRMIAWGLAICVAALTVGLRVLQKQIDELKSASGSPVAEGDAKPKD